MNPTVKMLFSWVHLSVGKIFVHVTTQLNQKSSPTDELRPTDANGCRFLSAGLNSSVGDKSVWSFSDFLPLDKSNLVETIINACHKVKRFVAALAK
jgi:hypothetical protein